MAFDFPNSPTTNQQVTGPNGAVYQWDGVKWISAVGAAAYAPLASPTFTGDPKAPTPAAGDADTSVATTAFVAPAFNAIGRNLLHNPLFNVQQRGAGPWTTNNAYTLDRWMMQLNGDTVSISPVALADADRTAIGDESATTCVQNVFTGGASAANYNSSSQKIEGVLRLSGKTVTISFWAKAASGTPKIGINIYQNFGTGGSPSASVWALATGNAVTLSTTWARYTSTVAIPSAVGKTLGSNNNDNTQLVLWYSSNTTFNANAGNIGVQSGTVQIWGVQLEIGTVATPLEKPDPQQDLAKCQRFYQVGYVQLAASNGLGSAVTLATVFPFPVPMRAGPTVTPNFGTVVGVTGQGMDAPTSYTYRVNATINASAAYNLAGSFTASADL